MLVVFGCNQNKSKSNFYDGEYEAEYRYEDDGDEEITEENYWDGGYCADIEYYNSNTGTYSNYTLTIEVSDNELEQINWHNGGYLDDFYGVEFDEDGHAEFTSDKGYDYEVQITGDTGDCFEDVPMAVQCNGITEDGHQCENLTDNYSGYCWQHEDQE